MARTNWKKLYTEKCEVVRQLHESAAEQKRTYDTLLLNYQDRWRLLKELSTNYSELVNLFSNLKVTMLAIQGELITLNKSHQRKKRTKKTCQSPSA